MATVTNGRDLWDISEGTATTIYNRFDVVTGNASQAKVDKKPDKSGEMSAQAYFSYVKGKFTKLESKKMEKRIDHLNKMAEETEKRGQTALSEEFFNKAIKELRESEIYACGFSKFIEKEDIEKFIYDVKDEAVIETGLKNFVHPIPKKAATKIKRAIKKRLFDEYVVLHYDPDRKASEATEEERKDPIVFGKIEETSRYYFIADWVDEYCDLTLDEVVEELSLKDKDMKLTSKPESL